MATSLINTLREGSCVACSNLKFYLHQLKINILKQHKIEYLKLNLFRSIHLNKNSAVLHLCSQNCLGKSWGVGSLTKPGLEVSPTTPPPKSSPRRPRDAPSPGARRKVVFWYSNWCGKIDVYPEKKLTSNFYGVYQERWGIFSWRPVSLLYGYIMKIWSFGLILRGESGWPPTLNLKLIRQEWPPQTKKLWNYSNWWSGLNHQKKI